MERFSISRVLGLAVICLFLWTSLRATDYTIEAKLDTVSKEIVGTATIDWRNESTKATDELRFHLYFNAWRNPKSSFLTSFRNRNADFSDRREDEWGHNEIRALFVSAPAGANGGGEESDSEGLWSGEAELVERIEFIQPDDGNPHDRTVIRVPLPAAVPPGAALQIRLDFVTKVPRTFARTGFRGDYYFLAHWFPKLGVLEEDGQWNCHQFIQTEFYSDFGTFDVRLRIPQGWVVGATGELQEKNDHGDGTVSHHFRQEQVHEFAWTASPDYLVYERKFQHPTLPSVAMRLLLMPDHEGQEDRYFAATEAALRYYGEWFGAYPYGHVTVVDPAYGSGAGGMEYPTLFTGGSRWLNPLGSGSPEGVTVHECGHQFWYGIVGNNEFEDAWLDEGFNTYSTSRVMGEVFEPTFTVRRYLNGFIPLLFQDLPRAPRSLSGAGGYYSLLKLDRMDRPSWQYGPGAAFGRGRPGPSAYGINAYTKPAMMLLTLERYLGWETFQKIMSTYFERYRFQSPRPEDFFEVVDEVSGRDLGWFWDQTYHSSETFDYAVDDVYAVDGLQNVVVRRWGGALFPVEVEVTFADGEKIVEQWDGKERWMRYTYPREDEIASVAVDPGFVLALDTNRTNNSWIRSAPTGRASYKWALKWAVWLQNVLESFVFFI